MAPTMKSKLTAEALGTFLLVFTVGCIRLTDTSTWGGVSIGSVLMVCIYALGGISGANFNPAVSLALALTRKIDGPGLDAPTALKYAGVQFAAGIAAGITYSIMFWHTFTLQPTSGFGWIHVALAEILYTFMLCFVVLNVAVATKVLPNQYYGLAIGFVIVAGAHAAGPISGGCFNPAVAAGIEISSLRFGWCIAYTFFEAIGAVLAAGLFKVVRPDEFGLQHGASELVSEFLGTFMLILTVALNVLAKSPAAALSIAASLMCMIYALGDVSGAHFNPAVTLAIYSTGRDESLNPAKMGKYMGCQVLGGVLAGFTAMFIHRGTGVPVLPGDGYSTLQALFAEVVFTFVLCYVVLCVAVASTTKSPTMFGLAIGACIIVGGNAIGKVSGGCLNPAVTWGLTFSDIHNKGSPVTAIFYTAAEVVGAASAAVAFQVTHADEKIKDELTV